MKKINWVNIASIILFLATAAGWAYDRGQNSKDLEQVSREVSSLKSQVETLNTKVSEQTEAIGQLNGNVTVLLTLIK